ncbi:hypothetical protein [Leuconostoc gasicomitatum]|uniref:hypothetical protein n=1 Tax=Leuconostoc gasicomitatum TaxID=115778 RepID=UPI0007DE8847|nr:hypothetical protein [Leuconostoc gasicomitatum]CUW11326.1 hypothetical protein PB1E_1810 [Leuconostoc gasicomitatum]
MKKLKENKMWITVVVIGLIVIAILLAMLHQQKQNSPESQSSSYSSSAKTSSAVESSQDDADAKAYAKKAAHMKGHVLDMVSDVYYTSWSKQDLINWAKKYNSLSDVEKHKASTNFGTSRTISNDSLDIQTLNNASESILKGDFNKFGYYDSVKEFNAQRQHSNVNPDNIQK